MPSPLLFFLLAQVLFSILYSLIALFAIIFHRRALRQMTKLMSQGTEPLEAYCKFTAKSTSIRMYVWRIRCVITCIPISLVFIVENPISSTFKLPFLEDVSIYTISLILMCATFISFYVSEGIYQVARMTLVELEAQRIVQMNGLPRRAILFRQIRYVISTFSFNIFFFELPVIIVLFFSQYLLLSVAFLLSLLFIYYMLSYLFATQYFLFSYLVQPIEQSLWANLQPRIQAWSRLAGVEFSSIYIMKGLDIFFSVTGMRRKTLFISKTALHYIDWRQQDALYALALGMITTGNLFLYWLYRLGVLGAFTVFLLILRFLIPFTSFEPVFLLHIMTLFLFFIHCDTINLLPWKMRLGYYLNADRAATFLTGDPAAMRTLLVTLSYLRGDPLLKPDRLRDERLTQFEELRRQFSPQAPYATTPIPSIERVGLRPYYLAPSLESETVPPPVPDQPYVPFFPAQTK